MGAQVPLDIPFSRRTARPHSGALPCQYLGKPVILALVYYQCPSLCNMILNGVVRSVRNLQMTAGQEYDVVAVSFDPHETPEMAAAKKKSYVKEYDRTNSENGWHFLTGDRKPPAARSPIPWDSITPMTPPRNQYAHASAIMILTPEGKVARYFYGIDYPQRDLRLGLVEASEGRIGSPVDQVLLYCYHYDPANGKYGLVIMNALRVGGLVTLACLLAFMLIMFRRDFRERAT